MDKSLSELSVDFLWNFWMKWLIASRMFVLKKLYTFNNFWWRDHKIFCRILAAIFGFNFFYHCVKYQNSTLFSGKYIFWKHTVFIAFLTTCPKIFENCAFPQNFHTRKLDKISVFYTLHIYLSSSICFVISDF